MADQQEQARMLLHMAEHQRRGRLTLGHRLDAALRAAVTLAGASAGSVERESPSAEEDTAPRDARGLCFEPGRESVADHFRWRFELLVRNLEREVDAMRLRPLWGSAADESTEDRDSRLLAYRKRGLSPREILLIDPAQGSIAAIVKAYVRIDKASEK